MTRRSALSSSDAHREPAAHKEPVAHKTPITIPVSPDLAYESALWGAGILRVAGVDEAGRGAWAGPVSAGAVILPPEPGIQEKLAAVRDSKQMTARARIYWADVIKAHALAWGVGFAASSEIDAMGIAPASRLAMTRALSECCVTAEHLLLDAFRLPESSLPQTALIKGDARSLSIAAASVLAKTARDALMERLDEEYPGYGFARHKGYGTESHHSALEALGPCAIHRFCYAPILAAVECANKKR